MEWYNVRVGISGDISSQVDSEKKLGLHVHFTFYSFFSDI